jgi:hypothetical protein
MEEEVQDLNNGVQEDGASKSYLFLIIGIVVVMIIGVLIFFFLNRGETINVGDENDSQLTGQQDGALGNESNGGQIIGEHTGEETCTESWYCTEWSDCINSQQTKTCTDTNSCGTTSNKPSESQSCSTSVDCMDSDGGKDYFTKGTTSGLDVFGIDEISYSDECSVYPEHQLEELYCDNEGKVLIEEYLCPEGCENGACIVECNQGWVCYDPDWSQCENSQQIRICQPTGDCDPKEENRSCTPITGEISVSWSSVVENQSYNPLVENGDQYYDPIINIGGVDYFPYADHATGTPAKWCQLIPDKEYSVSDLYDIYYEYVSPARWDGIEWAQIPSTYHNSYKPKMFQCS